MFSSISRIGGGGRQTIFAIACFYLGIALCLYYTIWFLGVPFIAADNPLRWLFPAQIYALMLPLLVFWTLTIVAFAHIKFRAGANANKKK